MARTHKTFDVFIAHSTQDSSLASEVASAFRISGLEASTDAEIQAGENRSDELWDALAESRALLAIVSPAGLTPAMGIEIGAARAWNKPIYTVVTDPSTMRLPTALAGTQIYTTGRIQDVVREIKADAEEFSDEDRSTLASLYSRANIPLDQLGSDPKRLDLLVEEFLHARGRTVAGEQLLSELMRLRKRGRLHRLRPSRSGS